jgi:hypothetical protein
MTDEVAEPGQERYDEGRHDQLRRLEPVDVGVLDRQVPGDVGEDRRVVALQHPARELDSDEEADDLGDRAAGERPRGVGDGRAVGHAGPFLVHDFSIRAVR